MTTLPDLLYLALIAVAGPLLDYGVFWPAYRRLSQADPAWARRWLWASSIGNQWTVVAFGAALWMASDRSWTSFGFTVPEGWRLWTAIALFLLVAGYYAWAIATVARSADTRANLRQQFGPVASVIPHTRTELYWFGGVSLTAGFCEEFLYRGYFIWVFAPVARVVGRRGAVRFILRSCAHLSGMERCAPHGNSWRVLRDHCGGIRFPLAGDRAACSGRSHEWNDGVAGAARGVGNRRSGASCAESGKASRLIAYASPKAPSSSFRVSASNVRTSGLESAAIAWTVSESRIVGSRP